MPTDQFQGNPIVRVVLGAAAIVALLLAMLSSGRVAVSSILVRFGETTGDSDPVDSAIRITPKDAEAHFARGAIYNYLNESVAALPELEVAVSLRPRDFGLWMELGMTRDQLGDSAGGLVCLNESVRLAPYYARPRWQRGNLLFRLGRYDEAFADLRLAVTSNPDFLPNFIDLAWGAARHEPKLTEQLLQFRQNSKANFALARFFAQHAAAPEAVVLLKSSAGSSPEDLRALVRDLISAGALGEAFEAWSYGYGSPSLTRGTVYDGGFEGVLNLDEAGFGWRLARTEPGLSFSLDTAQPQTGVRSLRIDFNGNANPSAQLLSQLILVEPSAHYKISFWARTKEIATGGPPMISIYDAKSTDGRALLGASRPLPTNSVDWQNFNVEFTTSATTGAITISLQRDNCSTSPCPVFGLLNLDSFALERVKQ